jgi:hypothetical protein
MVPADGPLNDGSHVGAIFFGSHEPEDHTGQENPRRTGRAGCIEVIPVASGRATFIARVTVNLTVVLHDSV